MLHFLMQVCEYRMTLSIVTFMLSYRNRRTSWTVLVFHLCVFLPCDLTSWILMLVTCAHLILYKGQNRIFFQVWELKEVKKDQLDESFSFLGWVCVLYSAKYKSVIPTSFDLSWLWFSRWLHWWFFLLIGFHHLRQVNPRDWDNSCPPWNLSDS